MWSKMTALPLEMIQNAMEIHRVKSTKKRTEIISCERNIKKAAKVLNMNARILKMEIDRLIKE
jgi:ActR/RegA family two-component response regulator